ncbi:MAG: RcpC/CpaB family pilus assembly protein [Candidatus Nanopelagicales bacterium]
MTSRNLASPQSTARAKLLRKPNLRHLLHRYRRPLAIVLGVLAILLATASARPSPEPTTRVIAASRTIEAGHTLTQDDLVATEWPVGLGAGSTYFSNPEDAVGRMTAGPVAQGEPLNAGRIVGPSLLSGSAMSGGNQSENGDEVRTQEVAAIVRLADKAYLALARPGDQVDILGADSQTIGDYERESSPDSNKPAPTAIVLAKDARVLAIPGNDSESGIGATVGLQSNNTESVVVLAVNPETAATLAGSSTRYRLSMVVNPRTPE